MQTFLQQSTDVAQRILAGSWATLTQMAPYLLFGFLMAGVLSVFINADVVRRHLGQGRYLPVIKAALFGVPLPLCSCGVIPVAASLRRQGASRGATTSFLLATPQTGVDSMLVTWSLLGAAFALFTPGAAFLSGILAGLAVDRFGGPERPPEPQPAGSGAAIKRPWWLRILRHAYVVLARDIALPLTIGILVAGIISTVFPPQSLSAAAGTGFGAKIVMLLVGIPVYVCASASAPIVASLVAAGVSPGAGLVFLMTGPATNAATVTTLWKSMGPRVVAVYLVSITVCALGAGTLMDLLFDARGWHQATAEAACHVEPSHPLPALLLIAVLVFAKTRPR